MAFVFTFLIPDPPAALPLAHWHIGPGGLSNILQHNCASICNEYLHTCLAEISSSPVISLLSSAKKSSCRSFETSNHWKFWKNPWFWDSWCSIFPKFERYLWVKSQNDPKSLWLLTVTDLPNYKIIFVCRKKKNMSDQSRKDSLGSAAQLFLA